MDLIQMSTHNSSSNAKVGILECSVCLEGFSKTGDGIPRILPCGHTFCHGCITNDKAYKCPLCKKPCPESRGKSAEVYPKNFQLLDQIDILHNKADAIHKSGPPKCDNTCDGMNIVTLFCIQCATSYCQACYDAHTQFKAFKSHTCKPWSPLVSEAAASLNCAHHPQFPLNIVCLQPGCSGKDTLICLMCVQYGPNHLGHKSDTVSNVVGGYRKILEKDSKVLTGLVTESLVAVNQVEDATMKLCKVGNYVSKSTRVREEQSSEEKAIAAVKAEHNRIVALLNTQTEAFIQKIKGTTVERAAALKQQHKQLNQFILSSYKVLHESEKLLKTETDDMEVMNNYKHIHDEILEATRTKRILNPVYSGLIETDYKLSSMENVIPAFKVKEEKNNPKNQLKNGRSITTTELVCLKSTYLRFSANKKEIILDGQGQRYGYTGIMSNYIMIDDGDGSMSYKCTIPTNQAAPIYALGFKNHSQRFSIGWSLKNVSLESGNDDYIQNFVGVQFRERNIYTMNQVSSKYTSAITNIAINHFYGANLNTIIETVYNKERGTIHYKITNTQNTILIDKVCFTNIPQDMELYPCIFMYNHGVFTPMSVQFDMPLDSDTETA